MVFWLGPIIYQHGSRPVLYKAFLLHDPYNPVSFAQVFRMSLVKFLLFYSVLICMIVTLVRSQARSHHRPECFGGFEVGAAPVIGFAVVWQGGDVELHMPLLPSMWIALTTQKR